MEEQNNRDSNNSNEFDRSNRRTSTLSSITVLGDEDTQMYQELLREGNNLTQDHIWFSNEDEIDANEIGDTLQDMDELLRGTNNMESFNQTQTLIDNHGLQKSKTSHGNFYQQASRGVLGTSEFSSKMRLGTFYHMHEKKSDEVATSFVTISARLGHYGQTKDRAEIKRIGLQKMVEIGFGSEPVNLAIIFATSRAYKINIELFVPGMPPLLIVYPSPYWHSPTLSLAVERTSARGEFIWHLLLTSETAQLDTVHYQKQFLQSRFIAMMDTDFIRAALLLDEHRPIGVHDYETARMVQIASQEMKIPKWFVALLEWTRSGEFGQPVTLQSVKQNQIDDFSFQPTMPFKYIVGLFIEILLHFHLLDPTTGLVETKPLAVSWRQLWNLSKRVSKIKLSQLVKLFWEDLDFDFTNEDNDEVLRSAFLQSQPLNPYKMTFYHLNSTLRNLLYPRMYDRIWRERYGAIMDDKITGQVLPLLDLSSYNEVIRTNKVVRSNQRSRADSTIDTGTDQVESLRRFENLIVFKDQFQTSIALRESTILLSGAMNDHEKSTFPKRFLHELSTKLEFNTVNYFKAPQNIFNKTQKKGRHLDQAGWKELLNDLHEFDYHLSAYPAFVVNSFAELGHMVRASSIVEDYITFKCERPHTLNKLQGFSSSFHSTFKANYLYKMNKGQLHDYARPYRTAKAVNIAKLRFIASLQVSFQCDPEEELLLPEETDVLIIPGAEALRMIYKFTNLFEQGHDGQLKKIETFGVNKHEARELFELLVENLHFRVSDADYHKASFVQAHGIENVTPGFTALMQFITLTDKPTMQWIKELREGELRHETLKLARKTLKRRRWTAPDVTLEAKHPAVISQDDRDQIWGMDTEYLTQHNIEDYVVDSADKAELRMQSYTIMNSLCGENSAHIVDKSQFTDLISTFTSQLQPNSAKSFASSVSPACSRLLIQLNHLLGCQLFVKEEPEQLIRILQNFHPYARSPAAGSIGEYQPSKLLRHLTYLGALDAGHLDGIPLLKLVTTDGLHGGYINLHKLFTIPEGVLTMGIHTNKDGYLYIFDFICDFLVIHFLKAGFSMEEMMDMRFLITSQPSQLRTDLGKSLNKLKLDLDHPAGGVGISGHTYETLKFVERIDEASDKLFRYDMVCCEQVDDEFIYLEDYVRSLGEDCGLSSLSVFVTKETAVGQLPISNAMNKKASELFDMVTQKDVGELSTTPPNYAVTLNQACYPSSETSRSATNINSLYAKILSQKQVPSALHAQIQQWQAEHILQLNQILNVTLDHTVSLEEQAQSSRSTARSLMTNNLDCDRQARNFLDFDMKNPKTLFMKHGNPNKASEIDCELVTMDIKQSSQDSAEEAKVPFNLQGKLDMCPRVETRSFKARHLVIVAKHSDELKIFADALLDNIESAVAQPTMSLTTDDLSLLCITCCWLEHFNSTFLDVVPNSKVLQTITRLVALQKSLSPSDKRTGSWLQFETFQSYELVTVANSDRDMAVVRIFENIASMINTMLFLSHTLSKMFKRILEITSGRIWIARLRAAQEHLMYGNREAQLDDLLLSFVNEELFSLQPKPRRIEDMNEGAGRAVLGLKQAIIEYQRLESVKQTGYGLNSQIRQQLQRMARLRQGPRLLTMPSKCQSSALNLEFRTYEIELACLLSRTCHPNEHFKVTDAMEATRQSLMTEEHFDALEDLAGLCSTVLFDNPSQSKRHTLDKASTAVSVHVHTYMSTFIQQNESPRLSDSSETYLTILERVQKENFMKQ